MFGPVTGPLSTSVCVCVCVCAITLLYVHNVFVLARVIHIINSACLNERLSCRYIYKPGHTGSRLTTRVHFGSRCLFDTANNLTFIGQCIIQGPAKKKT